MVRVVIEVCEGEARHRVTVRAASIPGGLSLAEEHHLDGEARVVFPIDPETFFAGRVPRQQGSPEAGKLLAGRPPAQSREGTL
ncbi:MAG: hypothetical protein H0V53_03940 [Rubrobacter sp.]|jgi:hypothetical protein|nr:hypothetical protein [Rubrobacter sp.]